MELTLEQKRAVAKARARARMAAQQPPTPEYSGAILPFSRMPDGSVQFDSNAGLVGVAKRAFSLPGEVYRGETQINDPVTGDVTDDAIGRSLEFASVFSPVNPAVRSGGGLVPGKKQNLRRAKPKAPTAEELLKAGSQGFDDMRATGAEYAASDVKRLAEALKTRMNEAGFDETTAPKTFGTLNKLADPPPNSVATIKNLHSARKTFGKIKGDPTDSSAARQAIGKLDEFISGSGDLAPAAGAQTAAQQRAGSLLGEANANYAAAKRSDLTQGIERAADLRAAAANSGKNTGNTIRQKVAAALLKGRDTAGFNASEKDALEAIVRGSRSANFTRDLSNKLGGGGGLGQTVLIGLGGAGGSTFGPVGAGLGGAAPIVLGSGSRALSNRLTAKALSSADDAIRMRSPLYQQRVQQAPMVPARDPNTEALIRALLLYRGDTADLQ